MNKVGQAYLELYEEMCRTSYDPEVLKRIGPKMGTLQRAMTKEEFDEVIEQVPAIDAKYNN